ncbi:uncharacterized protein [Dendrobates tinctorius]|uniref:uncharacterized protein n=1 Tax=Dendrobates tinctorius TaxID=92724 RepID=UPI003CC97010
MSAVQVVLLLGSLEGLLSQKIEVFQIPEVNATTGSDVFLPCTYNISGVEQVTVASYKWYQHLVRTGPEVSNSNNGFSGRISRATAEDFINNRTAHLIIHNVNPTDIAMYYCEVSTPEGKTGSGNGTVLHVTGEEGGRDDLKPYNVYIISLGTLFGIVAVVVLVVGYYKTCNQAPESAVGMDPIVYTEFSTLGRGQHGPHGSEVLQTEEMSHYMMENQQYNLLLSEQDKQKTGPSPYEEMDLYNVIP